VLGTLAHIHSPMRRRSSARRWLSRSRSALRIQLEIDAPDAGSSKADVVARRATLAIPFVADVVVHEPLVTRARHSWLATPPRIGPRATSHESCRGTALCSKFGNGHDAFVELGISIRPSTRISGMFRA